MEDKLLKIDEVLTFVGYRKTQFLDKIKELEKYDEIYELIKPVTFGRTNFWSYLKIQKFVQKVLNGEIQKILDEEKNTLKY